ncbi:MAG: 3-ketoacyl-ACP reductase [Clostridia bacterium]|nr:3-ketoacyl-ACP reductase [Clostridia bacterium]
MLKTALVTGGSRGIGRGIAERLLSEGYRVAITSRSEADEEAREKFLCIRADNSIPEDRECCVDTCIRDMGGIGLLVNNAGVAPNVRADLLDMSEGSMRRLIDINLIGPFFLTQAVARHMISRGEGTIINITSCSAYAVSTNRGEYCISKAALAMATQLYAVRLAEYGIPVYEIRPGIIATDMTSGVKEKYDGLIAGGVTPIKRWGTPSDVADAVSVLAGGKLPFCTGDVLNVDGGFHLTRL